MPAFKYIHNYIKDAHLRDQSLFMEGGRGIFFFPKFLKFNPPPPLKRADI
jgi:hypothetical protein